MGGDAHFAGNLAFSGDQGQPETPGGATIETEHREPRLSTRLYRDKALDRSLRSVFFLGVKFDCKDMSDSTSLLKYSFVVWLVLKRISRHTIRMQRSFFVRFAPAE